MCIALNQRRYRLHADKTTNTYTIHIAGQRTRTCCSSFCWCSSISLAASADSTGNGSPSESLQTNHLRAKITDKPLQEKRRTFPSQLVQAVAAEGAGPARPRQLRQRQRPLLRLWRRWIPLTRGGKRHAIPPSSQPPFSSFCAPCSSPCPSQPATRRGNGWWGWWLPRCRPTRPRYHRRRLRLCYPWRQLQQGRLILPPGRRQPRGRR